MAARRAGAVAAVAAVAGAEGRESEMKAAHPNPLAVVARSLGLVLALLVAAVPAALAQKLFASPEAAMNAFGEAVATNDEDALKVIFGSDFRKLIPPAGDEIRYRFLHAWSNSHTIERQSAAKALIAVGGDGWTFPVPMVKTAGGWRFDMRAGAQEMRLRRIGRNERSVMQVMLAIYDAEKEYASEDRNGDGIREYATKFESTPGQRDGLYWPTSTGEPESPVGPVLAAARAGGGDRSSGYYGYRYKLLTGQGKNAPGGAFDYFAGGRMIGGFAVIAWPVKYGDTAVMTFMVSHDGVLYEKDLGPDTAARAAAITRFDPDASWRRVEPGPLIGHRSPHVPSPTEEHKT